MEEVHRILYGLSFKHVIWFIIVSIITYYITEFFLQYKLLRWIYGGTIAVIIANLYNSGDKKDAAIDVYKLITL